MALITPHLLICRLCSCCSGGLFALFTGSLAYTHAVLIMLNLTTVEQLSMQSMKRRERAVLNAAFEMWEFRCDLSLRYERANH